MECGLDVCGSRGPGGGLRRTPCRIRAGVSNAARQSATAALCLSTAERICPARRNAAIRHQCDASCAAVARGCSGVSAHRRANRTAGPVSRGRPAIPWSRILLGARILDVEWRRLDMDGRKLGHSALARRHLGRWPLSLARPRLGLDRRPLAIIIAGSSAREPTRDPSEFGVAPVISFKGLASRGKTFAGPWPSHRYMSPSRWLPRRWSTETR
jgi:hypothetical protein